MRAILGSGEHRYRVVENLRNCGTAGISLTSRRLRSTARIASTSSIAATIRWWCSTATATLSEAGAKGLFARAHGLHIDAAGARMKSGETISADLIVLATGYKRQEELVRKLFGKEVNRRVGTIWGFGEE